MTRGAPNRRRAQTKDREDIAMTVIAIASPRPWARRRALALACALPFALAGMA